MIRPGRRAAGVDQARPRATPARGRALLCCALLALATAAGAEKADRDKPVNLEADRVTINDAKQTAMFEGNVLLTQGTLQIRGDRMEVRQDKDGFKVGITWGNPAYFRQKREGFDEHIEAWAERIEYDSQAQTLRMFERARLKRGQDEVQGNTISYDARTEFFQVIGGGIKAAAPGNPEGRVRAVIQPKPKVTPPASPPVSLKPADSIAAPREETGTSRK